MFNLVKYFLMKLFRPGTILICFFFNDTATTEIYTLSLHDALPISARRLRARAGRPGRGLPRGPRRPGGLSEPRIRHHPRHPPGRPRRPADRVRADPAQPGAALRRRARPGLPSRRRRVIAEKAEQG